MTALITPVQPLPRYGNIFPNDIIKRLQDLEQTLNTGLLPGTTVPPPLLGGPFLPLLGGTLLGGFGADISMGGGRFHDANLIGGKLTDVRGLVLNQKITHTGGATQHRSTSADVTYAIGDTTITSASGNFTENDVGNYIWGDNGTFGSGLIAYIDTVVSDTQVIVDRPCLAAATNVIAQISDPLVVAPLLIRVDQDFTSASATSAQNGFGYNANAGPRGFITIDGISTFHTSGAMAGLPLIFQSTHIYKNEDGTNLTDVGMGALFNNSNQMYVDSGSITIRANAAGFVFTDNMMFTGDIDGTAADSWNSFINQTTVIGAAHMPSMITFRVSPVNLNVYPNNGFVDKQVGLSVDTLGRMRNQTNPPFNNPATVATGLTLSTASWASSGSSGAYGTATYTTSTAHGLVSGQRMTITGISPSGYNVTSAVIDAVPSATTFTILIVANPGSYSSGGSLSAVSTRMGATRSIGVEMFSRDATLTTVHGLSGIASDSTITLDYVNAFAPTLIDWTPTFRFKQDGYIFGYGIVADSNATIENDPAVANRSLGSAFSFRTNNVYRGNAQAATMPSINEFWATPTLDIESGGTFSVSSLTAFRSGATVNTGAAATTLYQFRAGDIAGSGTIGTLYGFYVPYMAAGDKNVGSYNGSTTAFPAPATRTPTANYKIIPDATYLVLNGTTAIALGNPTGSIPCIAPGVVDGQRLRLFYTGSGTLTFTNNLGVTLGTTSAVMNNGDILDFMWSTITATWVLGKGAGFSGLIVAPSPVNNAYGSVGFMSLSGTYAMPGTPAAATAATFINYRPYLQFTNGTGILASQAVVANQSTVSNDAASSAVALRASFTVADTQRIRSDTQTNTVGAAHYSAYQSVTVDAIAGGAWGTKPDVYAGYSKLTASSTAGSRYGWYFDNTTLSGAATSQVLNYFFADAIRREGFHATSPALSSTDLLQPIIDTFPVIPTTTATSGQNVASAAFVAGTGVFTLGVTVASLSRAPAGGTAYSFPTSGKFAVFVGSTTNVAAVAAASSTMALITYSGVSGSTLTGCKNLSQAAAGTLTTVGGDLVAYMLVTPAASNFGLLPTGCLINRTITTTGTTYTDNGDPVNGPFTVTVNSGLGATAFSPIDVGSTIADVDNQIPFGAQISAYHSTSSVDVNIPFASPGTTTIVPTGGITVTVALPPGQQSICLIVDAPNVSPSGAVVRQVGWYSAALSGATSYNVGYWWDDGTGTPPGSTAFYGIYSPVFSVKGLTGDVTTAGTMSAAHATIGSAAANTAALVDLQTNYTNTYATTANMSHGWLDYRGTDTWSVAPAALGMFAGVAISGTFQNAAGSAINLTGMLPFLASYTKRIDTQTGLALGSDLDFFSAPTYGVANSGTFASGTHTGFAASGTINATGSTLTAHRGFTSGLTVTAGTVTTLTHLLIGDATGAGTVTTQIAIDIAAIAKGGSNIGIRNKASTLLGTTGQLTVDISGNLATSGSVLTSGTGGVGYATGAGGTVTQGTSRVTTVVNNHTCGTITLFTTTLAADTDVSFTLTNSTIAATDVLVFNVISGAAVKGGYSVNAIAGAGSATVTVHNHTPTITASEAPVIAFAVIKGVTS